MKLVMLKSAYSSDEDGDKFLGESLSKLRWKLAAVDERIVAALVQKLCIPEILAIILYNRNIKTVEQAEAFLDPKIRTSLPNPFDLKDMDLAAERIARAVINDEKITIYGDYDVDGATSTALLKRFLKDIGYEKVGIYIPNRLLEGYGPNVEALRGLKDAGNSLVITVDCGIVSFDPLREAKEIGLDIIVLDHHLSIETLPEAVAIVNPNRFDDDFPDKSLAAVGVVFLTIIATRTKLREKGWFAERKNIDLLRYLDLVALGTVCDVMSLTGVNRAFVAQGLKLIGTQNNIGLTALCTKVRLESKVYSYHLGFILGPRINAGGRVGEGFLGATLLSTDDYDTAYNIVERLELLNEERRAIEAITLEQAYEQIEKQNLDEKPVILVRGNNWHQGILGILASRIKERYRKPAVVVSVSVVDGIGKGSARSIVGIDFGSLIAKARNKGLVLYGGGHAMAGGFTLDVKQMDGFYKFLCEEISQFEICIEAALEHKVDAVLALSGINGNLVKVIDRAAPFGNGNAQPRFVLIGVKVISIKVVGKNHLMVIVSNHIVEGHGYNTLKCMLFKRLEHAIGIYIQQSLGKMVTLIGTIQLNFMNDRKADFIIEDVIPFT